MACFHAVARVGRARRLATGVPDEWSSVSFEIDRTRLTGHLVQFPDAPIFTTKSLFYREFFNLPYSCQFSQKEQTMNTCGVIELCNGQIDAKPQ
jgi:hypothetical protein